MITAWSWGRIENPSGWCHRALNGRIEVFKRLSSHNSSRSFSCRVWSIVIYLIKCQSGSCTCWTYWPILHGSWYILVLCRIVFGESSICNAAHDGPSLTGAASCFIPKRDGPCAPSDTGVYWFGIYKIWAPLLEVCYWRSLNVIIAYC